jgi:hypothetical protein
MKKLLFIAFVCLTMAVGGGLAVAEPIVPSSECDVVNNLNEPGSLLVFPLIQNTLGVRTIIEIANLGDTDVWLQGYFIYRVGETDECAFDIFDFVIHLTPKEPFWWDTSQRYNRVDVNGETTQIRSFANNKGFLFVWAVNNEIAKLERAHNELKGDALWIRGGLAWQYNAIPHQAIAVRPDRRLNLDGSEYTMATTQFMAEGFAGGFSGARGKLNVCSLDMDLTDYTPAEFGITFDVTNQNEITQSISARFCQFEQYDLTEDLELTIQNVFTPKWQMASISPDNPLWAVFVQFVSRLAWGGNVWQHCETGEAVTVILPPVPPLQ